MEYASAINYNVAIGTDALRYVAANGNVAIGWHAGQAVTSGSSNAMLGQSAGRSVTSGSENVLLGFDAGYGITTGNYNTMIGYESKTTSADNVTGNTLIGNLTKSDGDYNVIIGYNSQTTFSNSVAIGRSAANAITADNQISFGSSTSNTGAVVTTSTGTSSKYWEVIINGVAQKIMLV
jgi:hypothetical protein